MDVIGLYVSGVNGIGAGGSGYVIGDINTYPGGLTLKVLSAVSGVITQPAFTASFSGTTMTVTAISSGVITAGAQVYAAGVPVLTIVPGGTGTGGTGTYTLSGSASAPSGSAIASSVQIINPYASTCPSALSGYVGQTATTGSGSGATFPLNIQKPVGYGTKKLSRCWTGNGMTVVRSGTSESLGIGFQPDGSLDTRTLDGFLAAPAQLLTYTNFNSGISPRISVWNDQGGGGYDATQTISSLQPTISPGRLLGNGRSVMFDSVGQSNGWNPTSTYLNIPSGVSLSGTNFSAAVLAGTTTDNFNDNAYLQLGCMTGGCFVFGFDINVFNSGLEFINGNGTNIAPIQGSDNPFLLVGVSGASGVYFDAGNTLQYWPSGHAGNGTSSGGTIGQAANNNLKSGNVDEAAVIIVPWAISSATRLQLEASIYQTFNVQPQKNAVIVTVGDSHTDSWGQPFQQTWPRQMMALLNRQDITLVNAGQAGGQLSGLVASGRWNAAVLPSLSATNSAYKFVFLQGGYNDLGAGQTVSQVETSFATGISLTHTAGAKAICVIAALRSASSTMNANMQTIAAWERANPNCDYVLDLEAYSVFNAPTGPWNSPWFQSDQTHLTPAGAGLWAAMAAKLLAPLLP